MKRENMPNSLGDNFLTIIIIVKKCKIRLVTSVLKVPMTAFVKLLTFIQTTLCFGPFKVARGFSRATVFMMSALFNISKALLMILSENLGTF